MITMGIDDEMNDVFGGGQVTWHKSRKVKVKRFVKIKKHKAHKTTPKKTKRGTAIIETEKGILLTAINHQYLLPGGGIKKGESRLQAAIREVREETGLNPYYAEVLFRYESKSNLHTVCLIKAKGKARPKREVKRIKYYLPGMDIKMSTATKKIIEKYLKRAK